MQSTSNNSEVPIAQSDNHPNVVPLSEAVDGDNDDIVQRFDGSLMSTFNKLENGAQRIIITTVDDYHNRCIDPILINGVTISDECDPSIHHSDDVTDIEECKQIDDDDDSHRNPESTVSVDNHLVGDVEYINNDGLDVINIVVVDDSSSSSSSPPSSSPSPRNNNNSLICLNESSLSGERKSASNGRTFKTISHLNNGHETIFYDEDRTHGDDDDRGGDDNDRGGVDNDRGGGDDNDRQKCNGSSFKLLTTFHYKSAGTSTDECLLELRHEGCQCYPEEFLGQDLIEASGSTNNNNNNNNSNNNNNNNNSQLEASNNDPRYSQVTDLEAIRMRQDILKAQDKIQALDSTLKTMRAEKLDLLGQMKHLYATLESKEDDMNLFVKNFETKISEGNELISRLISEKSHMDRLNQDMEMKLQHALDQCVSLNLDLDLKNQVIEQLNTQLESSQVSRSDSNLSSIKMTGVTMDTNFSRSPTEEELLKSKDWHAGRSGELPTSSEASHDLSLDKGLNDDANTSSSSKDVKSMPSLSDVLQVHISQWKSNHILAWLEQDLKMGYYSQQCKENVKSGKVLLTMTDQELDSAFGLQSPIHRKKLRIAIDHLSNPKLKKFPLADKLSTAWITGEWLVGLGLPQFGPVFEAQLVDGRMLDHLTPKELEKNFTMISKTHVSSLLTGIQLLRMFDFDRKKMEEKRKTKGDFGCLLWSNDDLIRWLEDIDLQEYAPNLKKSGVHGALMVLDEKFTPLQLATEMGLVSSKSYLLRHLTQEYKEIVDPAKLSLSSEFRVTSEGRTRTLSRALSSSSSSKSRREDFFSSSLSFKGSLGRAFGRKVKKDSIQVVPTAEPVRMPQELLSIFDLPTSRDDNKTSTENAACNTTISAFSSLQSLPIMSVSNSLSKTDVSSMTSPSYLPHGESKLNGDRTPLFAAESESLKKLKTPKSNKYFTLRAFSGSSRRKSSGAK